MATTSFATDIAPMFLDFREAMLWRFDLTVYEQVRPNAHLIYDRISSSEMPPPPFPPLLPAQVELFKQWIADGFPQ